MFFADLKVNLSNGKFVGISFSNYHYHHNFLTFTYPRYLTSKIYGIIYLGKTSTGRFPEFFQKRTQITEVDQR